MPKSRVVIYREEDGTSPFVDWFRKLPDRAKDKVLIRLERLRDLGHELGRPEADFLRDGIYELRATVRGVHYRVLYFFHRQVAIVVAHGFTKEKAVPPLEIDLAIRRKGRFEANPTKHTLKEES
jgi:phage-related protein